MAILCLGDWHCAYVLLYRPRQLEVEDDNWKLQTQNNEMTSFTTTIYVPSWDTANVGLECENALKRSESNFK